MGRYHTDAFDKLARIYSRKKPRSKIDMMMDLSKIVSSYCDEGDSECLSNVYRSIIKEFHLAQNGPRKVDFPEDFDPKLEKLMKDVDSTLDLLNGEGDGDSDHDFEEVVEKLTTLQNEIRNTAVSNDTHKIAALCGASVAIESAKMWHEAYGDVDHPLYGLHDVVYYSNSGSRNDEDESDGAKGRMRRTRGRKLQLNLSPSDIVRADTNGAVAGVFETIADAPLSVLRPVKMISSAIAGSISSSTATFIGLEEDYYKESTKYYEEEEYDEYYAKKSKEEEGEDDKDEKYYANKSQDMEGYSEGDDGDYEDDAYYEK